MLKTAFIFLGLVPFVLAAPAQPARVVIDDDAYLDKVTAAGLNLVREHKLVRLETLRREVHTKGCRLKVIAPAHQKLDPPDLYEHLLQSTLAIGTLYKCPDCGQWHFGASAGFAVGEGGVVSTCCHVILTEDKEITEGYLLAADVAGHVFPVTAVLAADTDADTCFVKVAAPGLKPLPLRPGVRTGERVYCLSHPGGYHFMFTQGMVARLNRQRNEPLDSDHAASPPTRPVLFLNITAEFAPGSSGAPVVDEAGNVVGQVASIADAGDPEPDPGNTSGNTKDNGRGNDTDTNAAPRSPSVPVRFCTAAEEILRLMDPDLPGRFDSSPTKRKPKSEAPKDGNKHGIRRF